MIAQCDIFRIYPVKSVSFQYISIRFFEVDSLLEQPYKVGSGPLYILLVFLWSNVLALTGLQVLALAVCTVPFLVPFVKPQLPIDLIFCSHLILMPPYHMHHSVVHVLKTDVTRLALHWFCFICCLVLSLSPQLSEPAIFRSFLTYLLFFNRFLTVRLLFTLLLFTYLLLFTLLLLFTTLLLFTLLLFTDISLSLEIPIVWCNGLGRFWLSMNLLDDSTLDDRLLYTDLYVSLLYCSLDAWTLRCTFE